MSKISGFKVSGRQKMRKIKDAQCLCNGGRKFRLRKQ